MMSLAACVTGFFLDRLFGDPVWLYHPVRMIGNMISFFERRLQSDCVHEQVAKADCECPLYITNHIIITLLFFRQFSHRLDCRLHFFLSIVMGKTKPHSALLNRSKRLMHQRCTMSAWSCRNLPSFKQFITDL